MENSFNKRKQEILEFNNAMEELNLRKRYETTVPKEIPDDLIVKCPGCQKFIIKDNYILDHKVCPYCNYHGRLTARENNSSYPKSRTSIILSLAVNLP